MNDIDNIAHKIAEYAMSQKDNVNMYSEVKDETIELFKPFDWQPIETAPKDGTVFLACCGIWMTVCHWHRYHLCWATNGPIYSKYANDEQPTHWQPLPQPPNQK